MLHHEDEMTENAKQRWIRAGIVLGLWTLASLVYASHLYFYHVWENGNSHWFEAVIESLSDWYSWAALSFLILPLAAHFRFKRGQIIRALLVHIPASLFFSFLQVALHTAVDSFVLRDSFYVHQFYSYFIRTFHFGLLVYWVIVIIQSAVDYYRDQEVAAARLQTQLAEAQLQALKMQIQPHFLFNTLHAISSLLSHDPKGADHMLSQLAELLRLSLSSDQYQEVSLKKELEFLNKYLDIEKVRFQDRLTVIMSIDSDTLQAQIPNLILQPLVENSIRHGISERRGAGQVEIRASRKNGMLDLQVIDTGRGVSEGSDRIQEGIGLKNTRARLETLYGSRYRLELGPKSSEGGFQVTVSIPFHTDSELNVG